MHNVVEAVTMRTSQYWSYKVNGEVPTSTVAL